MQANGRFQRWNSKGSQQGLVEAAATDLEHFRGFKGLEPGKTAGLNALRTEGYVEGCAGKRQAAALEQRLTAGLVEAASKDLEGFRGLKGLNAGKRQVEAAAKDVEGFRGLKGLKAGKRHAI